jgi:hypothetical protein
MIRATLSQTKSSSWRRISATHFLVIIEGTLVGLTGMIHGLFEISQGNAPTGGYLLAKIGAFTILHNYQLTGSAAVSVGMTLILWTIGFIHKKNGPFVFLGLALLLFSVGGGFAQVIFFLIAFSVSTQINHPPAWMQTGMSTRTRSRLARGWLPFFITGFLFFLIGIAIWLVYTPPGTVYAEHPVLYWICWSALIIGLFFQFLTILSGFAHDIERMEHPQ